MVRGNVAQFGGGGIYNMGTLTLTNTTVSDNTAGSGGGIFNFRVDTIPLSGVLTLTDSNVTGNRATASGGGILNQGFDDGLGSHGAGIVTALNSTISGNRAAGSGGGAMNLGTMTLTDSTIASNTTDLAMGGGIYSGGYTVGGTVPFVVRPASLTLTNATVRDNSSGGSGGGVFNGIYVGDTSTAMLTNSTVSGNSSPFSGGGIFNRAALGIQGSTLTANLAAFGGAIANDGDVTFTAPPTTIGGNTGTMYWGPTGDPRAEVAARCAWYAEDPLSMLASADAHATPDDPDADARRRPDFREALAAMFTEGARQGAAGYVDDWIATVLPWGFRLADVACPVAIWWGDRDPLTPRADTQHLASAVPGARLRIVPGEGHSLPYRHWAAILDSLG